MNFNDNGKLQWTGHCSIRCLKFFTAPEPSLDKYKLDDNGNLSFLSTKKLSLMIKT